MFYKSYELETCYPQQNTSYVSDIAIVAVILLMDFFLVSDKRRIICHKARLVLVKFLCHMLREYIEDELKEYVTSKRNFPFFFNS